ncbi:proteasome assembly chaperone 3-like [Leguminivora glycinivorella]|uniref:proteasome assembly chaperone 3-like n=1 Tax=Leguminivora glycinivorella TaxID=1035111 RepID=UPI00200DB4C1|nr:proteasome assembly chaperone 3-like [Leguminivora glycinivorella]
MELLDVMKNLTIKHTEKDSQQLLFKSVAADIDDVPTEVVLAEYTDKTLLILSQYQKIGSMLTVQKDEVHNPLGSSDIYTTNVIFGATGEEQQVGARYLAEAIKITKPLNIFINLKSYDIETLKACVDIIQDLRRDQGN